MFYDQRWCETICYLINDIVGYDLKEVKIGRQSGLIQIDFTDDRHIAISSTVLQDIYECCLVDLKESYHITVITRERLCATLTTIIMNEKRKQGW